ncbi:MAG: diacylglycerol kinase family protein [Candidatus Omnitrophota bacterium]
MRLKLIVNPAAGRKKAKKSIPAIRRILTEKNLDFDIDVTSHAGEATRLSQKATKNDFRIIVAAGGDGTIHEVANGMIDSGCTLGVIPLGLGNDFAKGIGIPFKLEEACLAISEGITRSIDVGKINNRYFVNGLGIGFDALVARESKGVRKLPLSRWIYLCAALKALVTFKPKQVKIDFAKTSLEKKILLVAAGNGKSSGGGFLLTPEAEFDDGLIDVCIIDWVARTKLLMHLWKAYKGTHVKLPYVTSFKTKTLTVSSPNLLLAHADGEILRDYFYRIEILPRRLKVLVPKQNR